MVDVFAWTADTKEWTVGLSSQDIATIVAALQDSDWDEAAVSVGDVRIAVARNGMRAPSAGPALQPPEAVSPEGQTARPAPLPAPAGQASPQPSQAKAAVNDSQGAVITAPTVGVFWSSPEPGAAPFAAVGDRVEVGDIVCIVEIMKLMTNVTATAAGTIAAVHVENGENVEFGTPLFSVRED